MKPPRDFLLRKFVNFIGIGGGFFLAKLVEAFDFQLSQDEREKIGGRVLKDKMEWPPNIPFP